MTHSSNTWVGNASGFMHTGSGDFHLHAAADSPDSGGPSFRRVADDQLGRSRRVLVAPGNMGRARTLLASTGTVILDGTPGSGRTCAARVLLREYHRDGGTLQELQPEEDDDELPLRDPDLVEKGDQLLLDLSSAVDTRWIRACGDLPALRKTVHDRRAHLVVVMPHGRRLDADLQHYRVVISPPPALDVLRRHLREHGLAYEDCMRPDKTSTGFLRDRPLREVAEFADLVRRAREAAPDAEFAAWWDEAESAGIDRRADVATLARSLREAPQQALLITVAMLHGSHADVVHQAARMLLRIAGAPPDELTLLERKDLSQRFEEIRAETDARGRVRFGQLDFDAAVRAHYWDHVPDLRRHLGTWVAQLLDLKDPHMTAEVHSELVDRLAGQYLRTGRGEELMSLAEGWSSAPASRSSAEAAVRALACGLNDPVQGARLRSLVYQWCRERHLKSRFGEVLVRVCADVIAATHPDRALIRLYHLARRAPGTTRAREELQVLVATSRRLRRLLLDRLARAQFEPVVLAIFLETCDPLPLSLNGEAMRPLVREDGIQRSLTTCWHGVLASLPRTQWQPQVARWLQTAAGDDGAGGDMLLDVLVGAAGRCDGRSGSVFAALYTLAREAERSTQGDRKRAAATTERLLSKIRTAQGLRPIDSTTASAGGTRP
ncbi:hypothetical protein [Streptomyces sp. NPDC020917]|uniref:hypothetical protein n=1 Tax=Streptomyces sp. NPDC020917 TaxID=3365102 RepID=UPI0037978490